MEGGWIPPEQFQSVLVILACVISFGCYGEASLVSTGAAMLLCRRTFAANRKLRAGIEVDVASLNGGGHFDMKTYSRELMRTIASSMTGNGRKKTAFEHILRCRLAVSCSLFPF